MSTEANTEVLSMSDAEFENIDLSSLGTSNFADTKDEEGVESEETEVEVDTAEQDDNTQDEEEEESSEEEETTEVTEESEEEEEDELTKYKQVYEKLTQPFKANGKDIQIDNVDDAIKLMQMGANYSKKMTALKPSLKVLRMLEKHNLLDENKLNHLIDISSNKPEAIAKLLKDSNIDPLNVDLDTADQYEAGNYSVSDSEYEFEEVLTEVKSSSTGKQLLGIIGTEWDNKSRETVVNNPEILKVMNEHMGNGVFNTVMARVEKERLLGNLNGLTDVDAYYQIGNKLNAEGAFNKLGNTKATVNKTSTVKQSTNDSAKKKRAALVTSKAPEGKVADQEFNPLSMSDDEFEKMFKL